MSSHNQETRLEIEISWSHPATSTQHAEMVNALLDSGTEDWVMSWNCVHRLKIPTQPRPKPLIIRQADGTPMPNSGTHITQSLTLRVGNHLDRDIVCEVGSFAGEDLVIPHRWLKEHQPTIHWGQNKVTFDNINCQVKGCFRTMYDIYEEEPEELVIRLLKASPETQTMIEQHPFWARALVGEALASAIPMEYQDFVDVFSKEGADRLPDHSEWDHTIPLMEGKQPPWGPIYALSPVEQKALREYLDEMLASGKIVPSTSPAAAPILFVKKANGKLRLCVDFRGLNAITVKNRYPLPLMTELADSTKGAEFFTKIDLKNGYNLIRIAAGEEWKTAFRTKYGHFEYRVMPFGLTNAPASFQVMVNTIFKDLLDQGVVVYLDDILIYSKTKEEHTTLVKKILERLQQNHLYGNLEKTEWYRQEVEFLGFVLSGKGNQVSPKKVKAITEWLPPTKVKELQCFLGFANFLRRFIHRYSEVCRPMTDLLKKGSVWRWSSEQQSAFDELKERFTSAPILRHYDEHREAIIETDASDWAEAAVLSQVFEDGILHPVAYHSRKFNEAEVNYEIYDKEMLAIVSALLTWRHWLEGTDIPIQIHSDHQNLQYFTTTKKLSRRQARWAEKIAPFRFRIHYRPGEKNGKPDALTRRPEFAMEGGVMREQPVKQLLSAEQFVRKSRTSVGTGPEIIGNPEEGWTPLDQWYDIPGTELPQPLQDWYEQDRQWVRRVFRDEPLPDANLEVFGTEEADAVITELATEWTPGSNEATHDGRWVVPGYAVRQVIEDHHDRPVAGHLGRDKTLELIDRNYWWPGMSTDVANFVKTCDVCQRAKQRRRHLSLPQPLELATTPWTDISMDFVVEMPKEKSGFRNVLVVVDRFTKMAHFIPMTGINAEQTANAFVKDIWRFHGLPRSIVSDRGTQFVSAFWAAVTERLGIRRRLSTSFHPQTDGQTEKTNQHLESYLRAYTAGTGKKWKDLLPICEYAYNNAKHSSTGQSPFYCNYGFHPRTDWPTDAKIGQLDAKGSTYLEDLLLAHESARDTLQKTFDRMASRPGPAVQRFTIGQKVLLDTRNLGGYNKWSDKFTGPFEVAAAVGNRAYRLNLPAEWKVHDVFHEMLLRPYREDPNPGRQQNTRKRLATPDPQEALLDENFKPVTNTRPHTRSQGPVTDSRRPLKRQRTRED
ncbi:uncharacterized protein H6S33_008050 [Morchella sextelata]|uniref:uncharacterized protein n=1 Tax=Morchella sextelata TaxID=1174677 RepID=UPI001D04BA61|nr:uncharacterized protein H6S33_008050 [Morchella sextelata]KAH0603046.1 hypothetical protein H6S33_008050 [Morchella sextelata]